MSEQSVAYDWAIAALGLIWGAPIVTWIFFADFPIELTLGALAWALSVLVAATWLVRPIRRIVYRPDAVERGGPNQVAAVSLGFAFIGVVVYFVIPRPWFD
jgi:hypothetical protein